MYLLVTELYHICYIHLTAYYKL